jgi:hypothetical protein
MKLRIKFSAKLENWDWLRQTPGRKGLWGESQFFMNEDIEKCDFWFVYEDLPKNETVRCPQENTVLITGEPESVKKYNEKFLEQFGTIITSIKSLKHRNIIYSQQGLPWFVGGKFQKETKSWKKKFEKDHDELSSIKSTNKTRLMSIVFSDKTFTKGHIQRKEFVEKLKNHLGNDLDIFGVGFNEVEDKWDAIAPYKYHLAFENCSVEDYWTEKLSDAFLGFSYPIYYGCRNIEKYFDEDAMTIIDINDFKGSVQAIERAISEDYCDKYHEKIIEARDLVLNKYNVFALMSDFAEKHFIDGAKKLVTIHLQKTFEKAPNIFQRAKSKIKSQGIMLFNKKR